MRHANQQALTVQPAPKRRYSSRAKRSAIAEPSMKEPHRTVAEDALLRTGSKLPDRYWVRGENGLWSSVPRGSAAHRADREVLRH